MTEIFNQSQQNWPFFMAPDNLNFIDVILMACMLKNQDLELRFFSEEFYNGYKSFCAFLLRESL